MLNCAKNLRKTRIYNLVFEGLDRDSLSNSFQLEKA